MKFSTNTLAIVVTTALLSPWTPSAFTIQSNAREMRLRITTPFASPLADQETKKEEAIENKPKDENVSVGQRIANSSVASAAAAATLAVNAAVSMRSLSAPDISKSYISLDKEDVEIDSATGLPLVYDKDVIESYWRKERGALKARWSFFVGKSVPFLTRMVTLFIKDGKISDEYIPELSKQARVDLQDLGPTFIKLGQMMSVRPDVLPRSTLEELSKLQDSVVPFSSVVAIEQIEKELGGPLGMFFTSISEEPIAAASLAQVYLGTLNDGKNTRVAVKIQRPDVRETVSKDLYVLRRAAEVFQGLIERFAPQQKTNYVGLFNEWAIGFYTELDFMNEAKNQKRLRDMMIDYNIKGVTVPRVFDEYTTRRMLVSEFIDGVKLSETSDEQIAKVTPLAQEAFLTQLFEVGFFHADPHPGNILVLNEPTPEGHEIALIDCGLMASIDLDDRDNMISAVIHLANKDYASLVDDFMNLKILPPDSDRAAIIPLMDKALSPYIKGGGAKKYEEELKKLYGMEDNDLQSQVGGFQAMTQDALTVLNDVPFSIPPYFAILGRAIVTLEGVALTGDPNYGIIMESYPFIARKLLKEDRPEIQRALQEVLYTTDTSASLKFTRLISLLNNAAGGTVTKDGTGVFIDLDAAPEHGTGLSFKDGLKYLLSKDASSLRSLLEKEIDIISDILTRQILRRGSSEAFVGLSSATIPRPPSFLRNIFPNLIPATPPKLEDIPVPVLLPPTTSETPNTIPSVGLLSPNEFIETIAPKLTRDEELYVLSLSEVSRELFNDESISEFIRGEGIITLNTAKMFLQSSQSGAFGQLRSSGNHNMDDLVKRISSALSNVFSLLLNESNNNRQQENNEQQGLNVALDGIKDLSSEERSMFNEIMDGIVEKNIQRMEERLKDVPRIL